MKNFFYVLFGMLILASCNKEPEPCFTIPNLSEATVKVNSEIKLVSCSINAKKYDWDFGDGTVKTKADATVWHTYTEPGLYNIKLTVKNGLKEKTTSQSITVVD